MWQQVTLFVIGVAVILIGVCPSFPFEAYIIQIAAAILKKKNLCKVYGLVMLVFAFVVGLTSLLTGLDTIVLDDAVKQIDGAQ